MGRYLLEGDDSIRDFNQAINRFQIAAQANSPEAQYYLGIMARDGKGQPKSNETACQWFELAASQGYVPAYLQTSQLYFNAPVDAETQKLSGHDLVKAYLWLTATTKRTRDKDELSKATHMLKQVRKIMPAEWIPKLDKTVAEHLAEHSVP
jgi:TPR repeat protein